MIRAAHSPEGSGIIDPVSVDTPEESSTENLFFFHLNSEKKQLDCLEYLVVLLYCSLSFVVIGNLICRWTRKTNTCINISKLKDTSLCLRKHLRSKFKR